jgi:hypothetical protein
LPQFWCSNISAVTEQWAYAEPNFFAELSTKNFLHGQFGLIRCFIYSWNLHFNWYFWVIFENYSMRMLSIPRNDFIAHWAYAERFYRTLHIHGNDFIAHWAYAKQIFGYAQCAMKFRQFRHGHKRKPIFVLKNIRKCAEHSLNEFYCWLSMRGTNFIAGWACAERISLLAEHTWKC